MITHKNLGRLGRFGNQCFTIAGVIGLAIKNGHNFCFPQWINWDAKEKFNTTEPIDLYNYFENPLPEFRDINYQHVWINWGYHDMKFGEGAWDIEGHMQSEKYFSHCIDIVRYYLKLKNEPEQNGYTAIHYRAGDYMHGSASYHPRQPADYYRRAMEQIEGDYLVFSDDPAEARSVIGGNATYVEGNDYLTDFKLMKKCKNFIGANSSFSLMAAILSDHPEKKMAFPKLWFGDAAGGLSTKDIYPEGAIVI